jgi:hypothetical protein
MSINARQVNILRPNTSGTHTTLDQYLGRKRILPLPWNEVQVVSVSGVQFKVIDSTTHLPSGLLAVLKASPPTTLVTNAGICAAELVGAIGTAATTNYTDNHGNILNLVPIRNAASHDEITVDVSGTLRTVYALVQCANGVAEGAAIGASASENTQLSFVYVAANGTLTLTAVTASVEFCVNKVFIEAQQPDVLMQGQRSEEILVEPSAVTVSPICAKLVVTTAFANGEVLTIATGSGSTGRSTFTVIPTGSTVTIGVDAAAFLAETQHRVRLNGVQLIRAVEVEWESATTLSVNQIMDIGDVLEIEIPG